MPTRLPVLSEHVRALETCGYCPKLCRAKCPVSEAIPRESLTPWGKMSMAWLVERGDVPATLAHADVVWGCSGCHACRTACEHDNPVFATLQAARQHIRTRDAAPQAVEQVIARQPRRAALVTSRAERTIREYSLPTRCRDALLIGCGYWLYEPLLAKDLVASVQALVGEVKLVSECCGAVLKNAGDSSGAAMHSRRMQEALAGVDRLFVYDPGCAMALSDYPVVTVVELASQRLERLNPLPEEAFGPSPLRYHDPCQLGRGLGKYEEPRRVLKRLIGRAPEEFRNSRSGALCSGAGGLLPHSFPEAARVIGAARYQEHAALGGGTIVTACSSSYRHFKRLGAAVVDWASLLTRGVISRG